MIKLVLIDFDDTLCLTEKACFKMENEAAVSLGFPPMSKETHLKSWGLPLRESAANRIPGIDPGEFIQRLEMLMPSYIERGELDTVSEENLNALKELRKRGKKIAILTAREGSEVKHLIEDTHPVSAQLDGFFHKNSFEFYKPDPRVFDPILEKFGVARDEVVYIGDTFNDAVCSEKAGVKFIAVLESGLRTREDFKGYKVDFFADKFTDIMEYI